MMYTGKLVVREYLSDPVGFARSILVFAVLVGLCLFVFSLPTMFTEIRVGPHQTAEYDLLVTGAVPAEGVERASATGADVLPVYRWGGNLSAEDAEIDRFDSWIVGNTTAVAEMTELNSRYLIEGSYEEGNAVVSKGLADRLGVGVGDTVTYQPAGLDETVEYEVSGIIRPASYGRRTIVLDETEGMIDRIASSTPAVPSLNNASTVYGAAYVDCADASQCRAAREAFPSDLASVTTREAQIEKQRKAVERFTGSPVVRVAPVAGFGLYGLIYLRRSLLRADRHGTTYGVLRSLGASRRAPIAHILLDNAVVLTLTTVLGVVLAAQIYQHAMGIFVPMGPLFELSGTAFGLNAAIIGIVSAVVVRRHANRDVVEMLEGR